MLEQLVDAYPLDQTPQPIIRETFGCLVFSLVRGQAINFNAAVEDKVMVLEVDRPSVSVVIPSSLFDQLTGSTSPSDIAFCAYKDHSLFVTRDSYLVQQGRGRDRYGGNAVSARLSGGLSVKNLEEPVELTFVKLPVCIVILSMVTRNGKISCIMFYDRIFGFNFNFFVSIFISFTFLLKVH